MGPEVRTIGLPDLLVWMPAQCTTWLQSSRESFFARPSTYKTQTADLLFASRSLTFVTPYFLKVAEQLAARGQRPILFVFRVRVFRDPRIADRVGQRILPQTMTVPVPGSVRGGMIGARGAVQILRKIGHAENDGAGHAPNTQPVPQPMFVFQMQVREPHGLDQMRFRFVMSYQVVEIHRIDHARNIICRGELWRAEALGRYCGVATQCALINCE